ncbi:MAG: pyruvate kinase [Candidatus Aadella gelida]|nr:pyruvate kinase [Candidatus Aadella gelida]
MAKIVATVSPDTEDLIGIDIGRINGSFGDAEGITALAKRIIDDMGVPAMLDLPRTRKKQRTNSYNDEELIEIAQNAGISYLGLSYVCTGDDVREIRAKITDPKIKLISKIEAADAEKNLDDILEASDGVMIDRGDLANAVGFEKLPRLQKKIIRKSNQYGKMVIVATEMLMSMVEDKQPTKAEVLDIANAVSSGADYVMLSEETAIGKHPNHVVSIMKRIIDEVSDRYKVIILAAGSGAGLGSITAEHHVCLADVGDGKTILDTQLEALYANGIHEEDIIIAVGEGADHVREKVSGTDINVAFNPWYDSTNMLATIWLAKDRIRNGFIVIYGDVVFEPEILTKVLENKKDIVLAVEEKECDEEDEKICVEGDKMSLYPDYNILPSPKHKCLPAEDAFGEFIGIAKFNRQGAALLSNEMDDIMREREFKTYLMTAFERLVQKGTSLNIEKINGYLWSDNDTIYDLKNTRKNIYPEIVKKMCK